jgi:hypothetical protein
MTLMNSRRARKLAQTAAIAAALASLWAPVVDAQSNADVAVSACQRVPDGSSRLNCYDRAFPPLVATEDEQDAATSSASGVAMRREQIPAAALESRDATAARASPDRARIVELQMPSLTTTVLLAADGRVFVRENAGSILRWPDTPFDVVIETSRFGSSTYLQHPGTGQRVRVAVRDQTAIRSVRPGAPAP